MSISENIRNERLKNNMTQEELSGKLGITQSALAAFERGSKNPSAPLLCVMCDVFGISADKLLGRV